MSDHEKLLLTYSEQLEKYHRETLDRVRTQLPLAVSALKGRGVQRILCDYDGCGDSGQIEGLIFIGADGKPMDNFEPAEPSRDQVRELFYDLLEVRYAGWEINDGAYGEFDWDLTTNQLLHTHNARFTECETTEVEGL